MNQTDIRQRFVFDKLDARGCIVRLNDTCEAIQNTHYYPINLAKLLNQFALAAALLRDSIKIKGSLTIQLRSQGAIKLIMADCMSDRRIRAICEYESEELNAHDTLALNQMGDGAVLAITISPDEGERYQSIVPIENEHLADCLQDYFQRSEQLPSLFSLHSLADSAVGISVHALPNDKVKDASEAVENFNRLEHLLSTLDHDEAMNLDTEQILTRLFHEESCRLFEPSLVEFGCVCSVEKSLDAVRSLGENEVQELIKEQKAKGEESLIIDCHFCFQRYEFNFEQVQGLFQ